MRELKFNTILAKNDIAREIKDYLKGEPLSISIIINRLRDIELYLGEANQPDIISILNSKLDL